MFLDSEIVNILAWKELDPDFSLRSGQIENETKSGIFHTTFVMINGLLLFKKGILN